jgi:partner of Y14 and mago protein
VLIIFFISLSHGTVRKRVRKEIRIRPGFTPPEDVKKFKSQRQLEAERNAPPKGSVVGLVRPEVQAAKAGAAAAAAAAAMTKAQKKNEKRKEKRKETTTSTSAAAVVPDNWDEEEEEEEQPAEAEKKVEEKREDEVEEEGGKAEAGEEHTTEKKVRALRKKLRQVRDTEGESPFFSRFKSKGYVLSRRNNCNSEPQRRSCFPNNRRKSTRLPNSRRS